VISILFCITGRPSNGDIWHSLAGSNHAPDDQQPCAVVSIAVFQLWTQHHRVHCSHPSGDDSSDSTSDSLDEEDAANSAPAEGDSREVQGQEGRCPPQDVVGNDGNVQRSRGEPSRLSWTDDHPDADLDRVLPCNFANHAVDTRRHGESLGSVL